MPINPFYDAGLSLPMMDMDYLKILIVLLYSIRSKSGGSDTVRVRPPLPAPKNRLHAKSVFPFVMRNIGGWDFREHIKRMTFIKVYLHVS